MPTIREVLATIQRAHPQAFCQVANGPAAVQAADLDALKKTLSTGLPASVACGGITVKTAAAPAATGDLAGTVALVTGAASGLGLGMARGLFAAGACVILTDVDVPGLEKAAAALGDPARTCIARCDVTNEQSVAEAFDTGLARFGRLDHLVCAAGIAPPYNLVDFPLDKWRLAMEINLTGYFLCGREAARIFLSQGHGGSMVLLSSKSGLEPSKANSAYNATKAGELHLARGWALELGRDNVRVNCIAPGNVFEGSKIWNPDYIKKAAEKKGIKPEEVIPYYNSLTALNAEIKPDDIANAAVFLCSAKARRITGQVIVVDAGQVWTR